MFLVEKICSLTTMVQSASYQTELSVVINDLWHVLGSSQLTLPLLYQDIWWKAGSGWTFRYLWWQRGPFCHDTFVSDEEVSPWSFCPKVFKERAEVIEPMEVQRNFQCVFSVKKPLWALRILWITLSITTCADTDTFWGVSYDFLCTNFKNNTHPNEMWILHVKFVNAHLKMTKQKRKSHDYITTLIYCLDIVFPHMYTIKCKKKSWTLGY